MRTYLLTAGHCGRVGAPFWNGNSSRFLGYGRYENVAHDILLIEAPTDKWIWDAGYTKRVVGWDWARAGEWLCLSGATIGVKCNLITSNNFIFQVCGNDAYNNYECYSDLVFAHTADQWDLPCWLGDSGGPVFTLAGPGTVTAKGTITSCAVGGFSFQDFGTAYRDFNVTPVT